MTSKISIMINRSRKFILVTLCCVIFLTSQSNAQQFSLIATQWPTPVGGNYDSFGDNLGYHLMEGYANLYNNCESWALTDMNNDGLKDLVVTSNRTANASLQFGVGSSPYWKVFFSTGSGFSNTATNWSTPVGGYYSTTGVNYGYYVINSTSQNSNNCETWKLIDMNGDGLPDLVVTSIHVNGYNFQFGVGSSPYWKVYLNTGVGFSNSATNWSTPVGGNYTSSGTNIGYNLIKGVSLNNNNCENWNLEDMNNDGLQDLVVTSQYSGGNNFQFGAGGSPYWKVYLNTGTGFSSAVTNWSTPIGGNYNSAGINIGYQVINGSSMNYSNSENWAVIDMDNDGLKDLVVTSQSTAGYNFQFGIGSSPYWKVYYNTGTGFAATAINWSTPVGGNYDLLGTSLGYQSVYGTSNNWSNCENWEMSDLNNDSLPDLVVTSKFANGDNFQFGAGSTPYWKVYLSTGFGFSNTPTNWLTPFGGNFNSSGTNIGYNVLDGVSFNYYPSENWGVTDMNNDGLMDLVVTSRYTGGEDVQFGVGVSPYWKIYFNAGITGINNIENTSSLNISPNPFRGKFVVNASEDEESSYIISNILGEKIQEGKLKAGENEISFDGSKGIYLLSTLTKTKRMSEKIVVF